MKNLPFLDLPGPEFLNVFGLFAIIVLAVAGLVIRVADRTDRRPPPPVPKRPAAVEVAFLRGGVNQVIRTLVYDLVQRGYADIAKGDRIIPTDKTVEPGALDALESRVLETIQAKPKAHELFENKAQRRRLLELLEPVRARLAAEDLVKPQSVKVWRSWAQIVGTLLLLGFAGAKITVALSTGHKNVAYLVFLCFASILALFALAYVLTRSHASRRGRAYLDSMELAYRSRLENALQDLRNPGVNAFDGASLFLIGLYGFTALKGTRLDIFPESFKRAAGESGGNCGSSCGGSCGGGDGGCGGCGGD